MEHVNKAIRFAGRILLGLFILWQVFFLGSSCFVAVEASLREHALARSTYVKQNYPDFIKGEDPVHRKVTALQQKGLKRYGQATAQSQQWSLFAPNLAEVFSFGTVEVRWDNDRLEFGAGEPNELQTLLLPSLNEPEDINSFVRYKNFRLRKYETNLTPNPLRRAGKFDPRTEEWRDHIAESVRKNGDNMLAYLRWRWEEYQRQHPDLDLPLPTQVILYMHGYGISEPPGPMPWHFEDYGRHPIARWLPRQFQQSGLQALERFNPLTERYEGVP